MLQNGRTALVVASLGGHGEVVQMLLLAGANKEAADEVGYCGAGDALDLRTVVFVNRS